MNIDRCAGTRLIALLVPLLWTVVGQAAVHRYTVVLDQLQEVPGPTTVVPFAFGNGTLFYDDATGGLSWFLGYGFLSGAPLDAHIHAGAPGVAGPVVIDLADPVPIIPSGTFGSYFGGALLADPFEGLLFAEDLYVNIHTLANTSGEIRGQILVHSVVVPVPAAGLLLASACMLLTTRRPRRQLSGAGD